MFLHRQIVEHAPAFGNIGYVAAHPLPGRQVADVLSVEIHMTTAGRHDAKNGLERGGLAHAITPHQAHGLPLIQPERQIVKDVASAIQGVEVFDFQKTIAHAASSSSSLPR